MKHLFTATLLLLALLIPTTATAHDFEVDGIYYNILNDNEAEVTYKGTYYNEYSEYSGDIIIPPSVSYNGTTYSVTTIGDNAFNYCSALTSIDIPNSVTTIGNYAFFECSALTSLFLPSSVTSIGLRAFGRCSDLTSITVAGDNPKYDSRDNCNAIIETASNTLFAGCINTTIPYSVTTIGDNAFYECTSLTSINIPNSVTSIGDNAFSGCTELTSINIPNSITSIGNEAFSYCLALTSIDIPNSITSISQNAFYSCTSLTSIIIPNSVTSIGGFAFACSYSLTSINIPNSVTNIGYGAFYGCPALREVYSFIDDLYNLTMGNLVFYNSNQGVYSRRTLYVPAGSSAAYQADSKWNTFFGNIVEMDNTDNIFHVDKVYYRITSENTVEVASADNCSTIVIPSQVVYNDNSYSVTAIADSAFYGNQYLSVISLPETVNAIGVAAFKDCPNLRYFTLSSTTPPSINESFDIHCQRIPLEEFGIDGFNEEYEINGVLADFWLVLFVPYDSYTNYKTAFIETKFFSYITSHEVTSAPNCDHQGSDDAEYSEGYYVHFYPSEESMIYSRRSDAHSADSDYGNWYWSTTTVVWVGPEFICRITHLDIQAFAIAEGKLPSNVLHYDYAFWPVPTKTFDFEESDMYYSILSDSQVAFKPGLYYDPCNDQLIDWRSHYYSGDIVVPCTVTDRRTSKSYTVSSIGYEAFADCMYLNSVALPETITSVKEHAFCNCPNLSFIKCMGSYPPIASDVSFDENVYQNTTLYVPSDYIEAYRQAEGWKYFQNIVGFSDITFEFDGIFYSVTGENAVIVISSDEAYSGNIVIPETVTFDGLTYTVTGIGSGAFANDSVDFLTIPVSITSNIASDAFEGCFVPSVYIIGEGGWADGALPSSVDTLYISSGVTGVEGLQVNPSVIFSYSAMPPTCDENTFIGYDAELYVPASSLAAYFTAPYWCNFINIMGCAVEPSALTLDNDSISMLVGKQFYLTATVSPNNATPQQVFWTSTDKAIAKVGLTNGEITALKAGECDIMATLLDKTVVCHVTVQEVAPTEVTISQEFAKLEIGTHLALTATVLPENATDKVITWTTTNSEVATVDSTGDVMAVGLGECFIIASCRDKQAMCHVIVVEQFIYITLDQHNLSLLPNHIELLTPTVSPVSTDLVVSSSNPSVAAARLANGKIQVVGITEGTSLIRINSTDGYAEPDSCYVTVFTQRGDVNSDGYVNITDVTLLINHVLNDNDNVIDLINADANNDGDVNITDVTRLINKVLSGAELEPKDESQAIAFPEIGWNHILRGDDYGDN